MKKLVIAPREMHQDILNEYRKDNPFYDVKLITKESLLSDYYGKVLDDAFDYVFKKYDYSYDNVSLILLSLPFVDETKEDLFKIKEDLINNHLIIKNNHLDLFFNDKDIQIIGYSENDAELINVLDDFKLKYKFIKKDTKAIESSLFYYETLVDETFFILNKIAGLLAKGVDINDIYLYKVSDEYDNYLEKYTKSFGFELDFEKTYNLYSYPIANTFIKQYLVNHDFNEALAAIENAEDKDLLETFKSVINGCYDEKLPFEKQLNYFLGELKSTKYNKRIFKNAVKVIDKPIYRENVYIFVLGFVQGGFPKSFTDNKLLNDNYLSHLRLNTSLINSQIEEDILLSFFNSNNHFVFSYPSRSIANKYLISPFAETLGLNQQSEKIPDVIFSRLMAEYFLIKYTDIKTFYNFVEDDYYSLNNLLTVPYGTYNNQFNGANVYDKDSTLSLSYSSIKTYYECPFKYYLDKILKIDPFEETFATKYGSLCHEVLQHQLDNDFDFDIAVKNAKKNYNFSAEELPLLDNIIQELKIANDACMQHYKHMAPHVVLTEKNTKFQLDDKTIINGKIDKSIILKDKYLAIVDYKTGKDSFDPKSLEYGLSMQLPTYYLLAENDPQFKHLQIIGIYINNIIDNSITKKPSGDNLICDYYKLNGRTLFDTEAMSAIDNTICGVGSSQFISGIKYTKTGNLEASAKVASEEEFKQYRDIVKSKMIEANKEIRNNNFAVNPLKTNSIDGCKYCNFRDICFMKPYQRRVPQNVKINDDEEDDDNE